MPKQQSSLDSFLGTKKQKQTKLNFFAKKSNGSARSGSKKTRIKTTTTITRIKKTTDIKAESRQTAAIAEKENKSPDKQDKRLKKRKALDEDEDEDDDDDDDDEEEELNDFTATRENQSESPKSSRHKRARNQRATVKQSRHGLVLDDDDDDDNDDDDFEPSKEDSKDEEMEDIIDNDVDEKKMEVDEDQSDQEDEEKEPKSTKRKEKPSLDGMLKDSSSSSKSKRSKSTSQKKSEVVAKKMKDDKALKESTKWSGSMPYLVLCEVMEKIEEISGRLEIQEHLTDLFRQVIGQQPADMYSIIYLASNSVAPAYECVELGIGDAILIKAVGEAYGTNPDKIKKQYEKEGDLGAVAKASKGKQRTLGFGIKPKPLLAREVLEVFREIAKTTGAQSQKWKVDKIKKLLVRATPTEAKFIIRGLRARLRIGLSHSTVLVSLAHAVTLSPLEEVKRKGEEGEEDDLPEEALKYLKKKLPLSERLEAAVVIVKRAYSEVPSYGALLDGVLKNPLHMMHKICALQPGIPVEPMLAKPTKSIQEVLKRLNGLRFTCEFKYDGERAQVHMLLDGTTKVFSRNLLDTSEKFPEVPLYVKEAAAKTVTSFVLDAEVVAFNRETGNLVPFQVLSTRKKMEESADSVKVQVIVQAFDLMFLNGDSLLHKTLAERRKLLLENFSSVENKFEFAKSLDHTEDGDTGVLEEFLDTAVKGQCEGLMVKTLDVNAVYEPSKRSLNWLKLKKDYLEGLGDSVDLVPLGAYYGRGKRTGVYGAYLLACFDPESDEFQSVCKIGTGFSDEDLKTLAESLNKHVIDTKSSQYVTSDALECDVWFDAVEVWEVKAADLSLSSAHKGALGRTGEEGRGIGLRFPRFERVRTDKKPEEATCSDQILEMYYAQDTVANEANDDDDGI